MDVWGRRRSTPKSRLNVHPPPLLSSPPYAVSPIFFVRRFVIAILSLSLQKITFISRVIYLFARDTMPAPNHSSLESNRVGVFASSFPCAARKDLSMILAGRRVERRKTVPRRRRRGTGEGVGEGGGGGEVERGRPCKGHHSNCPGLPFIPFVRPSGALPHPPSPSASPRPRPTPLPSPLPSPYRRL